MPRLVAPYRLILVPCDAFVRLRLFSFSSRTPRLVVAFHWFANLRFSSSACFQPMKILVTKTKGTPTFDIGKNLNSFPRCF